MPACVALLLGDPCGVGAELIAKLLASGGLDPEVATVVIGEPRILARAQELAGTAVEVPEIGRLDEREGPGPALLAGPPIDPADAPIGEISKVAGKAVLDTFRMTLGLAEAGELDAICFGPCNKQAMHRGGLELEDELRFFVQVLDFKGHVGEVNATDSSRRRGSPRTCPCGRSPT